MRASARPSAQPSDPAPPTPARSRPGTAATILLLLLTAGPATGEPFLPTDDHTVLVTLERPDPAIDDELRELRDRLRDDPEDLASALRLAAGHAEIGRKTGDPRNDGYAEAALAPWWDAAEPPVPVLLLRAVLAQRRHDFAAALADLDRALARAPGHPQALLTRAIVRGVRGETDAARRDCRRLAGRSEPVIGAACLATVGRSGDVATAHRELLRTRDRHPPADPGVLVWVETLLGELAALMGDGTLAEEHFRTALAVSDDDAYLEGAFADLLLEQGRAEEVRALLKDRERIDPLLLRLAIAEDRLGHADRDRHVGMLRDRFAAARRRGDSIHLREEARFRLELLGEPDRALDLALANFAVQREPADLDLLVAAALAAGRPEAARTALLDLPRTARIDDAMAVLAAGAGRDA